MSTVETRPNGRGERRELTLVNVSRSFCDGIMPLGLTAISAYLKHYGKFRAITLLDANCQDIYRDFRPTDVVGISAVTQDIGRAIRFAAFVKERINIPVILGGVHLSTTRLLPEPFDIGVLGEGEATMLELMRLPDFSVANLRTVKGICYRDGATVVFTEPRAFLDDLDTLPLPDRELCNLDHYLKPRNLIPYHVGRTLTMLTSRGCPYRCRFCSTKAHWKRFRAFGAERVVSEMEVLIESYGVEIIHIFDDLFIADKKRLAAIHDLVVEKGIDRKVKFMCLVRADMMDDTVMAQLRDMHVVVTGAGMESGSDRVLRYLKRDTTTVRQNHALVELATRYAIPVMGSFMIGSPGETLDDMERTLDFIRAYRDNKYFMPLTYIATTFPGTDFWDYAMARNIPVDNYEAIVMDIPPDIRTLRAAPLLTDVPLDAFFELGQKFVRETIDKQQRFAREFNTAPAA